MASSLTTDIKQRVLTIVREQFNLDLDDFPSEIPPRTELGDLAFPLAFELVKQLKAATGEKKNPRDIAAKLAAGLSNIAGVAKIAAGIVDPGAAVLPGRPALEGDAHRDVGVGRI